MHSLFEDPVFNAARADIEALGVRLYPTPQADASPYAVIGGRSNSRWWLIPLDNGRVSASALAMFQPTLASARWIKRGARICSAVGLTRLWAKPSIYVSGRPVIASKFSQDGLSFAYFTGTDSPHRKAALQVMDGCGKILGFAKVGRHSAVKQLIRHEAAMLSEVSAMKLGSVLVPSVIYAGAIADAEVIVTDTMKTNKTQTNTNIASPHLAFLRELEQKASSRVVSSQELGASYRDRFDLICDQLQQQWRGMLAEAIGRIETDQVGSFTLSMSHGDFTPWNTFVVGQKLYVFDWEYAGVSRPRGYDMIYFLYSAKKFAELKALSTDVHMRAVMNICGIELMLREIERESTRKRISLNKSLIEDIRRLFYWL